MRLSEAILLGSTILKPMARNTFFPRSNPTHGCAMGMMSAAHGYVGYASCLESGKKGTFKAYSWAAKPLNAMPCGCKKGIDSSDASFFSKMEIQSGIMHVFNEHVVTDKTWTLEKLCDWVDSIDPTPRCEPPVQEPSLVETRQESTVSHD